MAQIQNELDHEKEGVIKYQLQFHEQALSQDFLLSKEVAFTTLKECLDELNLSRSVLKDKGLMGQDSARYGGDGFGNISVRINGLVFIVSGSQTGHLKLLTEDDVAVVDGFNIQLNQLAAHGLTKPSSESMTHGVCYQVNTEIGSVIHVHAPDIWHAIDDLGLPFTDQDIPYGTPQMARAVTKILETHHQARQVTIFGMKGHEDGIVVVGKNLKTSTSSLLECLNQALLLARSPR